MAASEAVAGRAGGILIGPRASRKTWRGPGAIVGGWSSRCIGRRSRGGGGGGKRRWSNRMRRAENRYAARNSRPGARQVQDGCYSPLQVTCQCRRMAEKARRWGNAGFATGLPCARELTVKVNSERSAGERNNELRRTKSRSEKRTPAS